MKARIITLIAMTGILIIIGQHIAVAEKMPTVKEVLDRYVEAIGGREAIEKLESRICIGREVTDLTTREQPIFESHYFIAYSKIPSSLYTEEWTDGGVYCKGFDGEVGWVKDRCGVRVDDRIGTRRLHWLLNPQNALRIEEYYPNLKMKGTRRVGDMVVYAMESPAVHRPLFFDTDTGLLVGFGFNWEVDDYREVDGVLFPHKVHMSRKGGSTVYEFSEVRHDEDIDDSLFAMPVE